MKNLRLAIASLTIASLLAACGGQDAPDDSTEATAADQGTEPLSIALPAPNAVYWSIYLALDKGWFEEEGFAAEVVTAQGSAGAVQQVAAGSAQMGAATPDTIVNGVIGGASVRALAPAMLQTPLTLVGQPGIDSFEQLRGKLIGVSAIKGGEITFLNLLLEQNGLDTDSYDVVVAGTTPAKVSALQADSVAAAVLFSPADYTLEREGFSRIGSTSEVALAQEVPLTAYVVQEAWASDQDRAARLRTVLNRANDWLLDPANKQEAVEIFAEASQQPAEDVAATYDFWLVDNEMWTTEATVTDEQIEATLDMMRANGDLEGDGPAVEQLIMP